MNRRARAAGAVTIAVIVAASTACAGSPQPGKTARTARPNAPSTTPITPSSHPRARRAPFVPALLTAKGLGLRAGPVKVPLLLQIPKLDMNASVLGVGINAADAMDAPEGPADDPVWQQAFWYRGSAIPGARSTALIAGHIDGGQGGAAIFGHLDRLERGDLVIVHDTRTGRDVRFAVTVSTSYSLTVAARPTVLKRIYGVGPVVGKWPQPSADGLSHLTLITCAGTFRNGTHDHRLVVYAKRVA
jgi:hypothetical protein